MKEEKLRMKLMLMKQNELIKKTDTEFQMMRRMECADKDGIAECISCGRKHHYKQMDGGHFISKGQGGHFGVRYDPNNVWAQCKYCNKHLHGNPSEYRARLIKRLGLEEVHRLDLDRDNLNGVWLRDLLIETYIQSKARIKELKNEIKP